MKLLLLGLFERSSEWTIADVKTIIYSLFGVIVVSIILRLVFKRKQRES